MNPVELLNLTFDFQVEAGGDQMSNSSHWEDAGGAGACNFEAS
jgi:hypothetical protein